MKILHKSLVLLSILILLLACEKDIKLSNSLMGKWYRPTYYFECLDFIDSDNVLINGIDFKYRLNSDSIYFQYSGNLYIHCYESAHKFAINYSNATIKVENIDNICLISGDTGFTEYCGRIEPNDLIGKWINQDNSDTLLFYTNNHFKRFYGWYDYTYSEDSLTIKYMGPDKIYVKPITVKYELKFDTLLLDFKQNYYPDLKKGIRKYIKQ